VATEDIQERLAQLPRRAVVAFAARCTRRVQPLTHFIPQQDRDAIDRAIASAEAFAKGTAADWAAHRAAAADARAAAVAVVAAAADAARATAADATRAAAVADAVADDAAWADAVADARAADAATADDDAWAAADARAAVAWATDAAARAARAATRAATSRDLERLIALNLGQPGTLGAPIDPSEAGPLGPLWPQGVPEWYTEAATGTGTPHEEPAGDTD